MGIQLNEELLDIKTICDTNYDSFKLECLSLGKVDFCNRKKPLFTTKEAREKFYSIENQTKKVILERINAMLNVLSESQCKEYTETLRKNPKKGQLVDIFHVVQKLVQESDAREALRDMLEDDESDGE